MRGQAQKVHPIFLSITLLADNMNLQDARHNEEGLTLLVVSFRQVSTQPASVLDFKQWWAFVPTTLLEIQDGWVLQPDFQALICTKVYHLVITAIVKEKTELAREVQKAGVETHIISSRTTLSSIACHPLSQTMQFCPC